MRKIRHYQDDAFSFHKKVVQSKKKPVREVMAELEPDIAEAFDDYSARFADSEYETILPIPMDDDQGDACRSLYSSKLKAFKELKTLLTTRDDNTRDLLCPYCTIDNIGSLDHYLPKEEFPEFSANPLNLLPCCPTCNSIKTGLWKINDERLFLNLYSDELPDKQYLFVDLKIINSRPVVKFHLDNPYGIAQDMFDLVCRHYDKLHLCRRFEENADGILSELELTIKSFVSELQAEDIATLIIKRCAARKKKYGTNYWVALLEEECCMNGNFFNYLLTRS